MLEKLPIFKSVKSGLENPSIFHLVIRDKLLNISEPPFFCLYNGYHVKRATR